MKTNLQRLGAWGEGLAADFLEQRGYRLIERNARTPYGEIDLVARQDEPTNTGSTQPVTVFVEVKTRRSTRYGYPEDAITNRKQAHLVAAAQEYLRLHPELEGSWRIDVVAILQTDPKTPPEIQVFENAIAAE